MTVRETQMVGMEAANDTAQQGKDGDADLGRGEGPRIRMGRDLPTDFAA